MAALEKLEMRFGIDRGAIRKFRCLAGSDLNRDLPRNRPGQLTLHSQDILEIAVVALGPESLVGPR